MATSDAAVISYARDNNKACPGTVGIFPSFSRLQYRAINRRFRYPRLSKEPHPSGVRHDFLNPSKHECLIQGKSIPELTSSRQQIMECFHALFLSFIHLFWECAEERDLMVRPPAEVQVQTLLRRPTLASFQNARRSPLSTHSQRYYCACLSLSEISKIVHLSIKTRHSPFVARFPLFYTTQSCKSDDIRARA